MPKKARKRLGTAALARREDRRNSTRRGFVLAARRFFGREGIYDSRIEDITRHTGLAKGTLYLYFTSKEELLLAVVQDAFDELRAFVETRLEGLETGEELTDTLFRAHVEWFAEHPDMQRILHQVRGALKFSRTRWRNLRASLRQHLEFVAASLARGSGRRSTAARRRELAVFLFGCASGVSSVQVSAFPDSGNLVRLAGAWSDWIGKGSQASGGGARARPVRRKATKKRTRAAG